MKIIANVENKTLRILENERSIFRGEYGADKLELYINKQLINEYPTITALLSNGRKIGPYSTDEAYGTETIDGVTYTVANFTLSKANGFTLSEGKMMITIWMNSNGKKEALGNITLNVINTTAFDDGDIIISGDVEGTLVNYRVELENLQGQVNTFNGRLTNVETNKADIIYVEENFVDKYSDQTIQGEKLFTDVTRFIDKVYIADLNVDASATFDCPVILNYLISSEKEAVNKKYVDEAITKRAEKTYVEALEKRIAYLEEKINSIGSGSDGNKTTGTFSNGVLSLENAVIENNILTLTGVRVENNILIL